MTKEQAEMAAKMFIALHLHKTGFRLDRHYDRVKGALMVTLLNAAEAEVDAAIKFMEERRPVRRAGSSPASPAGTRMKEAV